MPATRPMITLATLAGLGLPLTAVAQQTQFVSDVASFSSGLRSMWDSGGGFQYDFNEDYTVGASTGSLQIDPGPVSNSGVTVDTSSRSRRPVRSASV